MRALRFSIIFTLLIFLIWGMHQRLPVGGGRALPALGPFFNPFSGFWQNASPVAQSGADQDLFLTGLGQSVDVLMDDMMVPHLFAERLEDAFRVQGYLTARDRLWQMDMSSRKTAGRLAEVVGTPQMVELDRMTRRQGYAWAASRDLASWESDPKVKAMLDAYTEGVNAYIRTLSPSSYPLEYKILDFAPEPWTNLKSALIAQGMAEVLARKESDLSATQTQDMLGAPVYDALFPEWNPKQRPVIEGELPHTPANPVPRPLRIGDTGARPEVPDAYIVGSNNWAISGARSSSGKPILANDPHLNLTLPSIWYAVQIQTPEVNVYGVSLPGIPGVVIGFNEHLAWGITNGGHDVADWHRIRWVDGAKTMYTLDGDTMAVSLQVEQIGIRGREALADTVPYTTWGPVVHAHDADHPLRDYAFRWVSHEASEPDYVLVFLRLAMGKNWADFKEAIAHFDVPIQNFVMATREGTIGIQVQGRWPVRAPGTGRFLLDGSTRSSSWSGYIAQDQLPAIKNPAQGFVFSANQHSTGPEFPFYYTGSFEDWRGRHLYNRLIQNAEGTLDSMASMQLDNYSLRAAEALKAMLHLLELRGAPQHPALDTLRAWDCRYEPFAHAPTVFEKWYAYVYGLTWDEWPTHSDQPALQTPEDWRLIDMLERDTMNPFFDVQSTPYRESAGDIVRTAFDSLIHHLEAHPAQRWGLHRTVDIRHMARIPGLGRSLTHVGGHGSALNAQKETHGPSWRMLVALEDSVFARGVYPGGQSGNPGSLYYDNMVEAWATGKYYDLLFMRGKDALSDRIQHRLRVHPHPKRTK